jgi:hypothetical protein
MEGRLVFDTLLWLAIAIKHIGLAIIVSLMYSFAKEIAFEEQPTFDELYILILVFTPCVYVIGLVLSFTLFYAIFYIYSLMMFVIGIIILTILV